MLRRLCSVYQPMDGFGICFLLFWWISFSSNALEQVLL
jgi:hypothetical protein